MHIVGNTANQLPNLSQGNVAQILMTNPAQHVGGIAIPKWSDLIAHIKTLKYNTGVFVSGVNNVRLALSETEYMTAEFSVLSNRLFIEAEELMNNLNGILIRYGITDSTPDSSLGAAKNATDAENIVLGQTEATELYSRFTHGHTMTTQRLNEIYTEAQLTERRKEQAEAAAAAQAAAQPTTQVLF